MIAAGVAAMIFAGITSCSKANEKCFHVKYTVPAVEDYLDTTTNKVYKGHPEQTYELNKWCSDEQFNASKAAWESMGYTDIWYEELPKFNTEGDCTNESEKYF